MSAESFPMASDFSLPSIYAVESLPSRFLPRNFKAADPVGLRWNKRLYRGSDEFGDMFEELLLGVIVNAAIVGLEL